MTVSNPSSGVQKSCGSHSVHQVPSGKRQTSRLNNRIVVLINIVTVPKLCSTNIYQGIELELLLQTSFLQFSALKAPSKELLQLQVQNEHLRSPAEPLFVVQLEIWLKFHRKYNLQIQLQNAIPNGTRKEEGKLRFNNHKTTTKVVAPFFLWLKTGIDRNAKSCKTSQETLGFSGPTLIPSES